jgi:hypothetical protein
MKGYHMLSLTKILLVAAVCLALLSGSNAVSARVLRWDLENVTFEDGEAVRVFLFDADSKSPLVSWDIYVVKAETPIVPPFSFCGPQHESARMPASLQIPSW